MSTSYRRSHLLASSSNRAIPPARRLVTLALTVAVLAGSIPLAGCMTVRPVTHPTTSTPPIDGPAGDERTLVEIVRIVDGDTVDVRPIDLPESGQHDDGLVVRILGIDTPELNEFSEEVAECGAAEARQELERFLHQRAWLIPDPGADRIDRYGRTLAYLETVDGVDLSALQVRLGWATAYVPASEPEPERYPMLLLLAEQAKAREAGVWQLCS